MCQLSTKVNTMEHTISKERNKPLMIRILIILAIFITSTKFVQADSNKLARGSEPELRTIHEAERENQNNQVTSAVVTTVIGTAITEAILNALKDKAFSLFTNAVVNEIFDQEPDFATLSEKSLEDIRLIVHEEVDALLTHFSQSDARSALQALSFNMSHYSAKATQNEFDRNLLAIIVTDSADLITDKAFSSDDFPSSFFFMGDTYALSATLRLASLTEDFLQDGLRDLSFINNQAQQMVNILQRIESRVSGYVNFRVRFNEHESCKLDSPFCTWEIQDDIGNTIRSYSSFNHTRGQVLNIYIDLQNSYKLALMSRDARDTLINLREIAKLRQSPLEVHTVPDGVFSTDEIFFN